MPWSMLTFLAPSWLAEAICADITGENPLALAFQAFDSDNVMAWLQAGKARTVVASEQATDDVSMDDAGNGALFRMQQSSCWVTLTILKPEHLQAYDAAQPDGVQLRSLFLVCVRICTGDLSDCCRQLCVRGGCYSSD